jgi:PAS domain S-box-containing protein
MTYEERIQEFIGVIMNIPKGTNTSYCPLTGNNDMLDALATSLNTIITQIDSAEKKRKEDLSMLENANKELNRLAVALERSEKYYRTFFEKGEGLMCTHNLQGTFLSVNDAGARSIGYTPAELIGTNLKDILAPSSQYLFDEYLKNISKKKSDKGLMQIINRNGEKRIWQYHNYLYDQADESYVIGSSQDITDRIKMEEQLRKAKEEAEESEKIKELFLANTSHEIRTPMNAIVGFTELVLETPLNEEQSEYLNIIKNAGENLLVVINDILDFSKIKSGKINLEQIDFSLSDVVNSVLRLFQQKAKEKDILLSYQAPSDVPLFLKGDAGRLKQVLINLLSNAFKFTEKGSVKLEIKLLKETEKNFTLEFSVEDTGIGIPQDKLKYIFESFTQASNDTTRVYGGTGLGLTIVKDIIELQDGSVHVQSTPGVGSKFIFTLSLGKIAQDIAAVLPGVIKEEPLSKVSLKNVRVLLVEDNEVNRRLAEIFLNKMGCITDTAENGLQAIKKLKTSTYDIVLMDVQMPGMDGYETTKYIRTQLDEPINKIPIIAMTAHAPNHESHKYKLAGMDDYVSKPFEQKLLSGKIYNLISSNLLTTDVEPKNESQESDFVDFNNLKLSVGNEDSVMLELIDLLCLHIPIMMEDVKLQGMNKNWELLRQAAHKIKPTITVLKTTTFQKIIGLIEEYSEKRISLNLLPDLIVQAESMSLSIIEQLKMEKNKLLNAA